MQSHTHCIIPGRYTIYTDRSANGGTTNGGAEAAAKLKKNVHQLLQGESSFHGFSFNLDIHQC